MSSHHVPRLAALGQHSHDVQHTRDTARPADSKTPRTSTSGRYDTVYHSLKQRVSSLKHEQQRVQRSQKTAEEIESAAVIEQKLRYDGLVKQLEERLGQAQEQLRSNTERSSRMRLMFEREKKTLTQQLESVKKTLDRIEGDHANQVTELKSSHEKEVSELRAQLSAQQQEAAEREAAAKAEHAVALEEVDQWCCGEIEAVRHVAAKEKESMQQELTRWQEDFEHQRQLRVKAEETARDAEEQLQVAQEDNVRLTDALAKSQMECESLQHRSEETECSHTQEMEQAAKQAAKEREEEVLALKARHTQQLDLVNTRVQDIIARKDETIAALRTELAQLQEQMQQLLT